ncbi:uncharacterized protein LOC115447507 isoform X2 [Manduca sexta]|uniref:Uncharacterized protein n=1 Tax=Manduca sexta TaxID=7130 RepID=A0A921ZF41_MANSE|nr:uncharacterized protein LOC115447507 isoform X2 [Manduca sexta]KAG6456435.1 hypothetical protein O3G_MSEX009734 [Manduca sexta]
MEDLYGNLENYNEVNALVELKSENMQLKKKLEDYAGAMEKLQNDFDLLSSEFKKLEHNYSSLLKTARSEIERKTQIITNINMEKDMLVLTALKNGNKSVLHMRKNMPSYTKTINRHKDDGSVKKKKYQEAKEDKMQYDQNNESDFGNKRSEQNPILPSDEKDTIENTIHKPKKFRVETHTDSGNYVNSHIKENITYENNPNPVQFKPMDIKNRRKSIPATSVEGEQVGFSENDRINRDSQPDDFIKNKEDRRSFLKFDNDRHSSKSSGSSCRDERILGYHKPSRDIYRGRNYKHDNYKHRIRDKYDTFQKHKRYSPDRYNNKPSRDYYEENCHKLDFNRIRTRESPDRFHHNSYKEYRTYHDKNNYNDTDRHMHSPERYVAKHKIPYEYEEPYAKKPKPSYYVREKEDVMWNGKEIVEHQELTETFERLEEQYTSCKSPDHIYNEKPSEPKVIMDTAETPLDDPRLATSKYILSNDNGLERLSTIVGRNVDLKPVDKIKWNLPTVTMPCALTQPPMDEQLIKDLYTDIDEAQIMSQINSEEVSTDVQPIQNEHMTKDNQTEDYRENVIDKPNCMEKDKLSIEKPIHGSIANCIIPKIKKSHQEFKADTVIKEKSLEVIDTSYPSGNNIDNNDQQYSPSDSSRLPLENIEKYGLIMANDFKNGHKTCDFKNSLDDSRRVLSTREIVEGDLELSDETCDNTELQKVLNDNTIEKNNGNLQDNSTISVLEKEHINQNNTDKLSENEPCNKDNKLQEAKLPQYCDNVEDHTECSKKQKSKKKIHKHKDSEHTIETVEKKPKLKKDKKEKSKEATSKFNELFGDSNSLITPADLGIPAPHAPNSSQNTAIYVPIFEDALDATDLEQNVQVNTSKSKSIGEEKTSAENDDKIRVDLHLDNFCKGPPKLKHYDTRISNESITNAIHDNTKLQTVNKENDVVATIIISSGIQPDEINTESRAESLVNAEELLSDDIEQDQDAVTHKTQNVLIKALATSTPYKHVHQIDSKLPELTCVSNSTLTNTDCADTLVSNKNNKIEPTNEDLPDVRIFVKRRRRIVKTAK